MDRKKIIFLVIILSLIITAIASYFYMRNHRGHFVSPKLGTVVETIYGLGKVKSHDKYDAKLGVASTVHQVFVREGDSVNKNEILMSFIDGLKFTAPFSGTITQVSVSNGEFAPPQIPLLSLQNLEDLYIEVSLEQQSALKVKPKQNSSIYFQNFKDKKLDGFVSTLFPKNDEFITHIQVNDLPKEILPGMTADVTIKVGFMENALLIPLNSVKNGKITIKRNNKVIVVPVVLGGLSEDWAAVKDGDVTINDSILIEE